MSPVSGFSDIGLPPPEAGLISREQTPCTSRRALPSLLSSRIWPSLADGLPSKQLGVDLAGEPLIARMLSPAPIAISVVADSLSPNCGVVLSSAGANTAGASDGGPAWGVNFCAR